MAGLGILRFDLEDVLIFDDGFLEFALRKIFFRPAGIQAPAGLAVGLAGVPLDPAGKTGQPGDERLPVIASSSSK